MSRRRGATSIEYAMVVTLIVFACGTAAMLLTENLYLTYSRLSWVFGYIPSYDDMMSGFAIAGPDELMQFGEWEALLNMGGDPPQGNQVQNGFDFFDTDSSGDLTEDEYSEFATIMSDQTKGPTFIPWGEP